MTSYSSSDLLPNPADRPGALIAPAIAYHIRKIIGQNIKRLVPMVVSETTLKFDPMGDLNTRMVGLYPGEREMSHAVRQLERLALFHQSLSGQAGQTMPHRQELQETEQQIFLLLGLKLQDGVQQGKVLVVENEPETLVLLAAALTGQGYQMGSARDSGSTLRMMNEFQPDVILLDGDMAGGEGMAIAQQLKAQENTQDVPIILLGGLEESLGQAKVPEGVGDDYLSKPLQVRAIVARVKFHLKLRTLQRQFIETSQQLQTEIQERQNLEQRYRDVFDNAIDGVFRTTPEGQFLYANPALARIYGYDSVAELMTDITNISQQLYVQPGQRQTLTTHLKEQGHLHGVESQVNRKDGSQIWISESIRSVYGASGELLYYEGTVRDMTERRQIESKLRRHRKESEKLLHSILPASIGDRLRKGEKAIAESFDEVTVLLADIHGFTAAARRMSALEQVSLINQMFSAFDQLADQYQLEKIKTIRDSYLVAGGVPMPKPDHGVAIAQMALAMQAIAAQFCCDQGQPLQLKIGISTGTVVAGVIGTKRLTYDLWGDTVHLASEMRSTGQPGRIQVTAATYERLQSHYSFEVGQVFNIAGMNPVQSYWLLG
jgi:PAS domain S-box-containing protein